MRFIAPGILCFFLLLGTFGNRAVADSVHYVKATAPITLRDGTAIPLGAETPIQYDAGDSWMAAVPERSQKARTGAWRSP